jgi:hypothetical protein
MLDQLGLSFLPGANGPSRNEAGPAGGRLEDIVRILSLRLPKVLGARAIAPEALLTSPGGSALPSGGGTGGDPIADMIAQSVLQNMPSAGAVGTANPAGSFAPGIFGGAEGGPPPSPPKPRIIPIEEPPVGGTAGPDPNRTFENAMENLETQLGRRGTRPRGFGGFSGF